MRGQVLVVTCLLIASLQMAMQQEPDDSAVSCPALTVRSMRVICKSSDKPAPCNESRAGTKARMVWKKKFVRNGMNSRSSALVCDSSGEWAIETCRKVPPGYKELAGKRFYKFFNELMSWEAAAMTCQRDGAHLLVLDNVVELDAVTTYLKQEAVEKKTELFNTHVGVHDRIEEGKFLTIFGLPLVLIPGLAWGITEPTKAENGNEEDCLLVNFLNNTLHDISCSTFNRPFVCEIPPE